MPPKKATIVQFPCDHLVSPGVFQVDVLTGTTVYFFLKGVLIEGRVFSYFAHITPDETLAQFGGLEGGAKPAKISEVGYAIEYFIPNLQHQQQLGSEPYIRQCQLLDREEFFLTKDEAMKFFWDKFYLPYPKFDD